MQPLQTPEISPPVTECPDTPDRKNVQWGNGSETQKTPTPSSRKGSPEEAGLLIKGVAGLGLGPVIEQNEIEGPM
jgi:hypothetical protein